jgi:hypothetical protein
VCVCVCVCVCACQCQSKHGCSNTDPWSVAVSEKHVEHGMLPAKSKKELLLTLLCGGCSRGVGGYVSDLWQANGLRGGISILRVAE